MLVYTAVVEVLPENGVVSGKRLNDKEQEGHLWCGMILGHIVLEAILYVSPISPQFLPKTGSSCHTL